MAEVDDDTVEWWVMGTPGQFRGVPGCRYVHWKGDGITGCYAETSDPEDAERFGTKEEAMQEIATSLVQNDLDWGYGEIIPLKVTKTVKVETSVTQVDEESRQFGTLNLYGEYWKIPGSTRRR